MFNFFGLFEQPNKLPKISM